MKKIKLLGISLLFGMLLISCNKEKTENTIIGELVEHTDCKDYYSKSDYNISDYGSDTSCVYYSYDVQDKKLIFKHINAGFNCCPVNLFCEIDIINDTIKIKEKEEKAQCDCNCLYDLDINIFDIELKKYYISIDEPYLGNQEKILFEIDLALNREGEFLVTRTDYPWGI